VFSLSKFNCRARTERRAKKWKLWCQKPIRDKQTEGHRLQKQWRRQGGGGQPPNGRAEKKLE